MALKFFLILSEKSFAPYVPYVLVYFIIEPYGVNFFLIGFRENLRQLYDTNRGVISIINRP